MYKRWLITMYDTVISSDAGDKGNKKNIGEKTLAPLY